MANLFYYKNDDKLRLHLANSRSDAFIKLLVVAGSSLAITDHEKELVTFIAEKDQNILGGGTIGFDVCKIPFNIEALRADKEFFARVCEYGASGLGWQTLDFEPSEELASLLYMFRKMILAIREEDVDKQAVSKWRNASKENEPLNNKFPYCPVHNIITTITGCILCNGM